MSTADEPEPAEFRPSGPNPPPPGPRGPGGGSRRSPLALTLTILAVMAVAIGFLSEFWTEVLWFRQTGFGNVFRSRLLTQAALFLIAALLMGGAVLGSMILAYRRRPLFASFAMNAPGMDRYRQGLEPLRRTIALVMPGSLALFAGTAAMRRWEDAQLFLHARTFGTTDPQFHKDVGFYIFRLPMWQFAVSLLTAILVMSLVVAIATHYVYGGLRIESEGPRATRAARGHVGLLLAALVAVQAVSYWLSRYGLLTQENSYITGATYTGINATLPTRTALACIALMVSALFIYAAFRGPWRLPALGVALMLLSSLILGQLYPSMVQQFQVRPSGTSKEPQYLERGIAATRAAYGLDRLDSTPYTPESTGQRGALKDEVQTAASIRIVDPKLVSPAFNQVESYREYYQLPDPLDVDRYTINGTSRDTVVGVRELDVNSVPLRERQWVNDHTVYTHGYGVVAAYGNKRQANGWPQFFQRGLPGSGDLGKFEPRIYFGEKSNTFSIVGGPKDGAPRELDYFNQDQKNYTYAGDGGPRISNPFTRLLYAIKYRDQNILFTNAVNSQSQILYDRTPRERVQKVAPFLKVDSDAYPAVVDGRVKWIVDAYTTSNNYPYSQRQSLGEATEDSLTDPSLNLSSDKVNYLRNSVKATVDAYDGKVELYSWDDDPIIEAWKSAYPGVVKPMSDISGQLMSHLRYPEDLFKAQREILTKYHVTSGSEFYSRTNFWKSPDNPQGSVDSAQSTQQLTGKQPPYYLTLKMPGQAKPEFSLTTAFVLPGKATNAEVLKGYLAADSNAGSAPGKRADSYGKLRLLVLQGQVDGPGQIQNRFKTNPASQTQLNILSQGRSKVDLGNLLTLPIAQGMLYVQPVYVKSSSGTSFPLLQKILVNYGDRIGFADTLDAALNQVFDGYSGATAGDAGGGTSPSPGNKQKGQTAQQRLAAALATASAAMKEGQQALGKGDFAAYGRAQARLKDAIAAATAAQAQLAASKSGSKTNG